MFHFNAAGCPLLPTLPDPTNPPYTGMSEGMSRIKILIIRTLLNTPIYTYPVIKNVSRKYWNDRNYSLNSKLLFVYLLRKLVFAVVLKSYQFYAEISA